MSDTQPNNPNAITLPAERIYIHSIADTGADEVIRSIILAINSSFRPQVAEGPAPAAEALPKPKKKRVFNPYSLQSAITKFLTGKKEEGATEMEIIAEMRAIGRMRKSAPDKDVITILKKNSLTYHQKPDERWVLKRFTRG